VTMLHSYSLTESQFNISLHSMLINKITHSCDIDYTLTG
jgi:hypothetical protein